MCFANENCSVEGRRAASGRRCTECNYVVADCASCGNRWSYDSVSESHPHKCPECGKH